MSTAMILRKSSWVVILGPAKSDTVTREDDEIAGTVRRRRNRERERRCVREKGSHGTIRGDFLLSRGSNVHVSESHEERNGHLRLCGGSVRG